MQHIDDCIVSNKGIVTSYNRIFCIPQPVHSHRIVSSKIFAKITFAKRKWKVIFAKVVVDYLRHKQNGKKKSSIYL